MLTHRPVQQADLDRICTFSQNADELYFFYPKAQYPLTVDQLLLVIDQRQHSTVIEKSGEIAGFANFYYWEQGGCCKIGNVIVNPMFRRQGIAKYLIHIMLQKARTVYQANQVQVSCFNQNTTALLLYQQLGFKPFDIEKRLDNQGNTIALIHLMYELVYIL